MPTVEERCRAIEKLDELFKRGPPTNDEEDDELWETIFTAYNIETSKDEDGPHAD